MAGTKISDYDIGTTKWSEMLATIEKQRKGFIALSLTNYDSDSLPAIAAGSYVEISGALYGFTSEEAIGGTPTSGQINYIMVDPTPITAAWTTTAPTWSDAKNGWYDAAVAKRYVGGCYYDGTNYKGKGVYGIKRIDHVKYFDVLMDMVSYTAAANPGFAVDITYGKIFSGSKTNSCSGYCALKLPDRAIVTKFTVWIAYEGVDGHNFNGYLYKTSRSGGASGFVEMANVTHSGQSSYIQLEDTSISEPIIDNNNNVYYVRIVESDASRTNDLMVFGVRIEYKEFL